MVNTLMYLVIILILSATSIVPTQLPKWGEAAIRQLGSGSLRRDIALSPDPGW